MWWGWRVWVGCRCSGGCGLGVDVVGVEGVGGV